MKIMIKGLLTWLIIFGISFAIQSFGWTDQGTAFLWVYGGIYALIIVFGVLAMSSLGNSSVEKVGYTTIGLVAIIAQIAIIVFATWLATKLFNVSFAIAFQIMTFGAAISSKKDK